MVKNTARTILWLVAMATACSSMGCGGGEQGDECTKEEDCEHGLMCQPIKGRDKDYCCPTPPESSSETNCHPAN